MTTASAFAGGSGTASDPYQIATPAELLYFDQTASGSSDDYEPTANIDLSGSGATWTPITDFAGTLNGQGYTISNLTIDTPAVVNSTAENGFFGNTSDATIKNLTLSNISVTAGDGGASSTYGAILAGYLDNTQVSRVSIEGGTLSYSGTNAPDIGAFAGYADYATLRDSQSTATVDVGGGTSSSTDGYIGGIAGYSYFSYMSDVSVAGSGVTAETTASMTDEVGGVVGYGEYDSIVDSSASVPVTVSTPDSSEAGGFIGGTEDETLTNDTASGAVTTGGGSSSDHYAGGFLSWSYYSVFQNDTASGQVSGGTGDYTYAGGFSSYGYDDHYNNVAASGSVSGSGSSSSYLGGFLGFTEDETLTQAKVSGAVVAAGSEPYAGGLIGYSDGGDVIAQAWVTSSVTNQGTGAYLGGLEGYAYNETISNSAALGAVNGAGSSSATASSVGGAEGYGYSGSLSDSYASGLVTGTSASTTGGLVGSGDVAVSNAYWDTATTGQSSDGSTTAVGLTTAQMESASNFSGWNFTTVWSIQNGVLPYLQWTVPSVSLSSAPAAAVGQAYSATLTVSPSLSAGGVVPDSIDGLMLTANSNGVGISGTPDAMGSYSVPLVVYANLSGAPVAEATTNLTIAVGPPAVTGLTVDSGSVTAHGWTESWQPERGVGAYQVDINGNAVATVVSGTSYTVTGETPGTSYDTTVAGVYDGVAGAFSTPVTVTTPPAVVLPAPKNLAASNITDNGFTATWGAVYGADSYVIGLNGTQLATLGPSVQSFTFSGEAPDTSYALTVAAVYAGTQGTAASATVQTLPAPPKALPAPTSLSHQNVTPNGWLETWSAVSGASGYLVDLNGQPLTTSPVTGTQYAVSGVSAGTTYQLTVAAVYGGVTGAYSSPDTVTTPSPATEIERTLTPGWNTLSLPYALSAASKAALESVLNQATSVFIYGPGMWKQVTTANVDTVLSTPMQGMYIDWPGTEGDATLILSPTSQINPPPTYTLVDGWNLVGPSSTNPSESDTDFLAGLTATEAALLVNPNGTPEAIANPLSAGANTWSLSNGYAYWLYAVGVSSGVNLAGEIPTGKAN